MNYSYLIPGQQLNTASFVANSTLVLGSYTKGLDARTLISVDYSKLIPAITIKKYSFRVSSGGEPQLWIDGSVVSPALNSLTFFVSGGIAGQAYEITIVLKLVDGERRSDTLTVSVLDDGCSVHPIVTPPPVSGGGGVVSGDGLVFVNTAPRFFISSTPPVSPNVLDRWYDTTTGQIFDCTSSGVFTQWTLSGGSGGGGGGSGGGGSKANITSIQPITPDGFTTIFALSAVSGVAVTIIASDNLFVSVDGVWQQAGVQYTAVNNTIQFAEPPTQDSIVFMLWFS